MDVVSIGETLVSFTSKSRGPMRHAGEFISRVAGAETNTLIGLSRLGHQTGWISRLGNDELGRKIQSTVRGEGIDASQVIFDDTNPTGIFFKEIIHESDIRISYYRDSSAARLLNSKDIDSSYIKNAKILYLTGVTPALSESSRDSVFHAIKIAKQNGMTIIFDPNVRRKLWNEELARQTLVEIATYADIVLPGISEGAFLFNTTDPSDIANHFHRGGSPSVIVKLGAKGAYCSTESMNGYIPGFDIPAVVDPVGAGDGFAAGLMSGILDGLKWRQTVERACAMGAITVTVNGDFEGLPERESLFRFMRHVTCEDIQR